MLANTFTSSFVVGNKEVVRCGVYSHCQMSRCHEVQKCPQHQVALWLDAANQRPYEQTGEHAVILLPYSEVRLWYLSALNWWRQQKMICLLKIITSCLRWFNASWIARFTLKLIICPNSYKNSVTLQSFSTTFMTYVIFRHFSRLENSLTKLDDFLWPWNTLSVCARNVFDWGIVVWYL